MDIGTRRDPPNNREKDEKMFVWRMASVGLLPICDIDKSPVNCK